MKVGITIDLSSPFWSNGFNQYLVFLYESLEEIGCDCYYLSEKEPKFLPPKNHKGMVVKDLIADKSETFDVVVYGSFILSDDCIDMLYNRNRKIKFNLINYSNKIFDDISFSIYSRGQKFIPARPKRLSSVWLNEEFGYQSSYVKTFYKVKNVKAIPFMWESCFIENEKNYKGLIADLKEMKMNKICIFEPNESFVKSCVIPLMICENFNNNHAGRIDSINIFSSEKIKKSPYFVKLASSLNLLKKRDFCFFNNKWKVVDSLKRFGGTVVSHNIMNELNFNHLEVAFLGLPLIHNSEINKELGYFYDGFDVDMACRQILKSMNYHKDIYNEYRDFSISLIEKFNPKNKYNIERINNLINEET